MLLPPEELELLFKDMENRTDNSREYIFIFKEQFDYLDILSPEQFYELFRMIRDLRFNGKDIKVKDIDDVTLKGIWVSLRPQILKSARNARFQRNKQEPQPEPQNPQSLPTPVVETPQPQPVKPKPIPAPTQREQDLEMMFRAKLKQGQNRKWVTDYNDIIDAVNADMGFAEWLDYMFKTFNYTGNEIDNVWARLRAQYVKNIESK